MQRPEAGLLALAGCVALGTAPCYAQSSSSASSVYEPRTSVQLPPMRAEVIDGVRFQDIETKTLYRLFGIEACAPSQTAMLGRQPWPCGTLATAWLVNATLNRWVACTPIRVEGGEQVARCATASYPDIAAAMLREGIAVRAPAKPDDPVIATYIAAEQQARTAYRGLWSSAFQMPWEWRAEHPTRSLAAEKVTP